jgi:hypothetical protein
MKVKRNITAAALALSLVAGVALAATSNTDTQGSGNGSGYGMMNGQGPHHGFGGAGWHGKGMRGNNQDCWNGNGGSGGRMGQKGMMRGGSGMSRGAAMSPEMQEKRNAFMESTKDLRKDLHDKQFAYVEAQRNPDLTQGELQKQGDEIYTLRQELRNKRQEMFKTQ